MTRARLAVVLTGAAVAAFGAGSDLLGIGEPGFGQRQALLVAAGTLLAAAGTFATGRTAGRVFRSWRARSPRTLALALGSGLTILLLVTAEIGVCVYDEYVADRGGHELAWRTTGDSMQATDPDLGYRLTPGARTTRELLVDGRTAYRATYSVDGHGRRRTDPPGEGRDRFLAFFGDSFVFGTAVEDDQTLPWHAATLAPRHRAYNYGVGGYGPQHALALLEREDLPAGIPERAGHVVFVFINQQVERAAGLMRVPDCWGATNPCYRPDGEDGVVRDGTFETAHPARVGICRLLDRSCLARHFGFHLPLSIGEPEVDLVARILARARDLARSRLGAEGFHVLIHPGSDLRAADSTIGDRLASRLAARGVDCLDYRGLYDPEEDGMRIPHDGHPTGRAHRIVAEALVRDLGIDR